MKILLSAYACEPWKGSEPDVGFQTMLSVAEHHDVWVLTKQNNLTSLETFLRDDPRSERISLHGLDLGPVSSRLKKGGRLGLTWYYHRWQGKASELALQLDRMVDFDAVFHITFASYWMKVGAAWVDKPLLLGPVGGAVEAPIRLLTELGWRGVVEELFRGAGRRIWFRLPGVRFAAKRASHILVNNRETGRRLATVAAAPITVLPNPTAVQVPALLSPRKPSNDIAFVGRLIPWKGVLLALRCMRYVQTPGARLLVFGEGPDQDRIVNRIRQWGLEDRVVVVGHIARSELLERLSKCGAMIHPALHEEGGNVVAEALAMEVPVVCLDRGGPPITLSLFPAIESHAIEPKWPTQTARAMAAAIDRVLQNARPRGQTTGRPRLDFKHEVLTALQTIASGID